jgi:hypothetical protein
LFSTKYKGFDEAATITSVTLAGSPALMKQGSKFHTDGKKSLDRINGIVIFTISILKIKFMPL